MTLTERGALRGCIGHIAADRELGAVVQEMAIAAARDDPRFAPVSREELPSLALEISVLTERTLLPAPVDAARVVVARSRNQERTRGDGRMGALALGAADARELLDELGSPLEVARSMPRTR